MPELDAIARFQEAMFEILDLDLSPEEARQRLCRDPRTACYAEAVRSWDAHMISVAQQLLKKWGVRRGEGL